MANRNPLPNRDENLDFLAEDLLGVDIPVEGLNEPADVEIEGLSLEELGFGPTPQEQELEAAKLEAQRQADILSLVNRAKQPEPAVEAEQEAAEMPEEGPVPARKPVRSLLEEISGEDFGAGLLEERPEGSQRSAGAGGCDADFEEDIEDEPDEYDEEDEEDEEDDFGADLDEEDEELGELDADELEEIGEDEETAEVGAAEEDSYWDALEGWEWNDEGAEKRRGPRPREAGAEGERRGAGRRVRERTGRSADTIKGEGRERQGGKPRRDRDEVSRVTTPQRKGPPPEPVEDEFGAGLLEDTARLEAETTEPEEKGEGKKSRRRRRRRKGRPEEAPRSTSAGPVSDEAEETFDELEAEDEVEATAETEEGDEFGAGLGLEAPAQRRPPRRERAAKPKVETEQPQRRGRPERERGKPPERVRQPVAKEARPVEATAEPDKDRYQGIPTWEEAINLLARKPPSTRSGGDDRRGRPRGRRGGGRPRRG